MKQMPAIEKYMTTMPHTVGPDISIKTAFKMMREYRIRHLPVLESGELIGILTDRDVKLASSFQHSEDLKVEEIMTPEPYAVAPQVLTDHVVIEMAEHKLGCAVIQQENGKVVGIFTAVEAMRVLGEILKLNYKPSTT